MKVLFDTLEILTVEVLDLLCVQGLFGDLPSWQQEKFQCSCAAFPVAGRVDALCFLGA